MQMLMKNIFKNTTKNKLKLNNQNLLLMWFGLLWN